jgi:hypothetical protein
MTIQEVAQESIARFGFIVIDSDTPLDIGYRGSLLKNTGSQELLKPHPFVIVGECTPEELARVETIGFPVARAKYYYKAVTD